MTGIALICRSSISPAVIGSQRPDGVVNANHIHSVWRDLRHGWGDDLLAAHYAVFGH